MIDLTEGKLEATLEFASTINDDSLKNCLARLQLVDENTNSETTIYTDFAPKSFYFVRQREVEGEKVFAGNGGIIYHGDHDNGGDGGAPTFSVNLTPTKGWSIHT